MYYLHLLAGDVLRKKRIAFIRLRIVDRAEIDLLSLDIFSGSATSIIIVDSFDVTDTFDDLIVFDDKVWFSIPMGNISMGLH